MLRNRTTVGHNLSMNTKIYTTVTMAIIFAFLSLFSFNSFDSNAGVETFGNKMRVVKTEQLNNKNVRWDYLMDQQVIELSIETAGKRKAMCLDNMHFNLDGNSKFVLQELSTAFVCYNKEENKFGLDKIVSEKIDINGQNEFVIPFEKMKLRPGINHFWIVIKPNPGKVANPQDIVVDCTNITINKMKFEPQIPIRIQKEKDKREEVDYTF
ncbi:MAG: hypothetical protein HKO56_01590 [Bacteroidia bacterium]|nr:hypothetical protein [Bacteroidia bacterium]NNC86584.1 hypothetical protein [Bacteroidia bacterium]NNM15322.1 hypothetical protein [Bacteroidia bacterium]